MRDRGEVCGRVDIGCREEVVEWNWSGVGFRLELNWKCVAVELCWR